MRIALWTQHPGRLLDEIIDEAICLDTHGVAEHAAFIRKNGWIHEAYLPRVRDRQPVADELPYVKTFHLRGLPDGFEDLFEEQFDRSLPPHTPVDYSVADLFRFLFNLPNADDQRTFCSRYVFHTILKVVPPQYWPLVRVLGADWIAPRDLFISPVLVPAEPLQLI